MTLDALAAKHGTTVEKLTEFIDKLGYRDPTTMHDDRLPDLLVSVLELALAIHKIDWTP